MEEATVTLEQVVSLANQLSPLDKLRLIARMVPEIERELTEQKPVQLKSLRGLWKGLVSDISAEEIDELRKEMWGNFPREDI